MATAKATIRKLVREHSDRGQDSGWSARLRIIGWRSTKRTATQPSRSRKHGSKAGRR